MSTSSLHSASRLFPLLFALTLTHCVTSDPVDQQNNDENLRTVEDQGAQGDADMTADMSSGGLDMDALIDQGSMPVDMGVMLDMTVDAARDMTMSDDMSQDMPGEDMMAEDMAPDMPLPSKCRNLPEDDVTRAIIAAHPYNDDASQSNVYEVLTLNLQSQVVSTGKQFEMGRAFEGKVHFTPDGEVGVVRQEDGTLGIFKIDANYNVTIIDPAYAGLQAKIDPSQTRYFSSITMTRDGSGIIATNGSWRNVGGAVWYIPLDCTTGFPGQEVLLTESKLPRHVQQLHHDDTRMVVASHDILAPMVREDAHLIDITAPIAPVLLGSGRVFPDDDATMTAMTISEDDQYVLLGDANLFGGPMTNNRIGVLAINPGGLTPLQILSDIRDPADIVVSPYHNAALVTSFEGNDIVLLDYDSNNTTSPFSKNGSVRTNTPPLLPSTMVMVRRGALGGSVLVAENTGIRTLAFTPTGDVMELHNANFGDELSSVIGAIGVQP